MTSGVGAHDSGITDRLAGFAVETQPDGHSEVMLRHAKRLLLDTIGVTLAAAPRPIGRIMCGYVRDAASGLATASVIGAGFKVSAPMAAMANGTMSNALDYDEGYHVATHVVPAALAVTEHARLNGRQLIDAIIVGYECGAKLTRVIDARRKEQRGPTQRGWWHVGIVGPVAAALTAARLLKLDRNKTRLAIGIATCSSGGFRRNLGTMAKGLHSGLAARGGIEAAVLAVRGFTADPNIIEAPLGFLQALADPDDRDIEAVTERLGRPFALEQSPRIKVIPACTPAHGMIDTAVAALAKAGRSVDEIASVEADLHPFSLNRPEANDDDSAGFSGAYLVAAALTHGGVDLEQVTGEATREPAVRALAQRIRHVPAGKGREKVILRFRDGQELTLDQPTVSRRLETDEAVEAKFRVCAAGAIDGRAIAEIEAQIATLEMQQTIDTLMAAARGSP